MRKTTRSLFALLCLAAGIASGDTPATVTPEWVREEIARQVAAATNALYLTITYGTTNLAEIARIEREQAERSKRTDAAVAGLKRRMAERKAAQTNATERAARP